MKILKKDLKFRSAKPEDLPGIRALLQNAKLPVAGVEEHIEHFILLQDQNDLIGVVGLEIYGKKALLRSLAVAASRRGKGFGDQLYQQAIQKAKDKGITDIYLLTETAEKFFARRGFLNIPRSGVDEAVKSSVEFQSACPQSAACMRLALV